MKEAYLICVGTDQNNNKFYKMKDNGDGTLTATWGRVGERENSKKYPISDWDKIHREKTGKVRNGYIYKDVTELKSTSKVTSKFGDVQDTKVKNLLNTLQKYSKTSILDNYTVTSESVTKVQVDKAQEMVDEISTIINKRSSLNEKDLNKRLADLYMVIPRKMKKVQDFLLDSPDKKRAREIISNEQNLLDVMAQQVDLNQVQQDTTKIITLEDALGVKITQIDDKDVDIIKELMGSDHKMFKEAFKVENIKTQPLFEEQRKKSMKHWVKLLWHGSRNENWLNIVKTGLLIRPSGVVLTGAMFGNGIYMADKFGKSLGYTSLEGSYWASGRSKQAFLALYDVNTGMELRIQRHEGWMCQLNEKKLKERGDYDCLFAKGGYDLRNNEYIIYNKNQCTIKYLVEVER